MKAQHGEVRVQLFKLETLFSRMFPQAESDADSKFPDAVVQSEDKVTLQAEEQCDPPVMNYTTMVLYCDVRVHSAECGKADRVVALADSGATYNLTDRDCLIKL